MKPICKSEARWKYWRDETRAVKGQNLDKFVPWAKKQMRKARRRFLQRANQTGQVD